MRLTEEQKNVVVTKLWRISAGTMFCPACNSNAWQPSDTVFELREFTGGNLVVGGPIYPVLPILCTNCGHTMFFNALVLGVIAPAEAIEAPHAG